MVVVRTSLAGVRWWGGVVRRIGVPGRDLSNGLSVPGFFSPHVFWDMSLRKGQRLGEVGVGGVSDLALVARAWHCARPS